MTAKDIRKSFEKVKFGYQAEEVDAFLRKVQVDYAKLEEQLAEANGKVMVLADKINEYKDGEEDLKNALLSAQKQARQIIDEAKQKASEIEDNAKSTATSAASAAKEEQEKQLQDISAQLEKENRVLVETQRQVAAFKKSLFDMYRAHLEQISNLPDIIDEEDDDDEDDDADETAAAETTAETESAAENSVSEATAEITEPAAPEVPAAPAEPEKDPFSEVEFSEPKKPISRTAEFDTRYKDIQHGNRGDKKRRS